jgi:DNA-binding MarR family transcriptional regulator
MTHTTDLASIAREVESHLTAIRTRLRQPVEAEFARGNLTGPQRSVMQALFQADGLSLKDLSHKVGLAHSTVSGIVDRLEKQGLAERKPNEKDGRATVIAVSAVVRDYMRERYPMLKLDPVTAALRRATPSERTRILAGLRALRRAVEAAR